MSAQQPAASLISVKDVVKCFPVGDAEITILKGISFEMQLTVGHGSGSP